MGPVFFKRFIGKFIGDTTLLYYVYARGRTLGVRVSEVGVGAVRWNGV